VITAPIIKVPNTYGIITPVHLHRRMAFLHRALSASSLLVGLNLLCQIIRMLSALRHVPFTGLISSNVIEVLTVAW
jgi:hypothetical protein